MPVEFSYRVVGADEVLIRLNGLAEHLKDYSPAMEQIGALLLASYARNFAAQGRPPWVPLKPKTIQDRVRKGFGPGPILQRTGLLRAAAAERGHPLNVFQVTPLGVVAGTRYDVALFHQDARRSGTPKRPMIQLHPDDERGVIRILHDYVHGTTRPERAAFFRQAGAFEGRARRAMAGAREG